MFVFGEALRFALIVTFTVMSFLFLFCSIVGLVDFVRRTLCKKHEDSDND